MYVLVKDMRTHSTEVERREKRLSQVLRQCGSSFGDAFFSSYYLFLYNCVAFYHFHDSIVEMQEE